MTRKRLKKLLMSCGFQRNDAEELCRNLQKSGTPYARWWRVMVVPLTGNKRTPESEVPTCAF